MEYLLLGGGGRRAIKAGDRPDGRQVCGQAARRPLRVGVGRSLRGRGMAVCVLLCGKRCRAQRLSAAVAEVIGAVAMAIDHVRGDAANEWPMMGCKTSMTLKAPASQERWGLADN